MVGLDGRNSLCLLDLQLCVKLFDGGDGKTGTFFWTVWVVKCWKEQVKKGSRLMFALHPDKVMCYNCCFVFNWILNYIQKGFWSARKQEWKVFSTNLHDFQTIFIRHHYEGWMGIMKGFDGILSDKL